MASFLDRQSIQFTPYQSQLPEGYAELLTYKQSQYNEGIQKVDSYLQSLSGLDVVRDVDQKYLNGRIDNLTSEINKTAGSTDWSNKFVQNQVGSLASKIYNDPKIQNAVAGTFRYKKLLADIGEYKRSGKGYSVQNEWDAISSVQGWLGNQEAGAQYSGKNYSPYVDVNGKAQEYLKNIKPNWIVESNPMSSINGKDGTPIAYQMVNNKKEYIDPSEVKKVLQGVLQPEDYNQLDINGRYSSRYYTDPILFKGELNRQSQSIVKGIQSQIDGWRGERQKNENNQSVLNQLNTLISQAEKDIENTNRKYSGFRSSVDEGNMEGVKSQMYLNEWLESWGQSYGYTKSETSYEESPVWKAILAKEKNEREWAKHTSDLALNEARIQNLLSDKSKKSSNDKEEDFSNLTAAGIDNRVVQSLKDSYVSTTDNLQKSVDDSKYIATYDALGDRYGIDSDKLNSLFNVTTLNGQTIVRPKKGKESEVELEYANFENAWSADPKNVPSSMKNHFDSKVIEQRVVDSRKKAYTKISNQADKLYNTADLVKDFKGLNLNLSGNRIFYSPEEMLNISQKITPLIYRRSSGASSVGTPVGSNRIPSQQEVDNVLSTDKERYVYSIFLKNYMGQPLNQAESALFQRVGDIGRYASPNIRKLAQDKAKYIDEQLTPIVNVEQASIRTFDVTKPEEIRAARQIFNEVITAQIDASGKESGGRFRGQIQDADKYFKEEGTNYQITYNPDGSAKLRLFNPTVSSKGPLEIDIDEGVARNQRLIVNDPYRPIKQLMAANRTPTGVQYTGTSRGEALKVQNPSLNKYELMYNLKKTPSGGISIMLNVYDKNIQQWIRDQVALELPGFNSVEAAQLALQNPQLEQIIDAKLKTVDEYR